MATGGRPGATEVSTCPSQPGTSAGHQPPARHRVSRTRQPGIAVPDPDLGVVLLLALSALAAGFVDAVVGGGGLIQLPALLVGLPQATPAQVLATNKLGSICGTTVSSATYYRRVRPDPRTFVPLMLLAFTGSVGGAICFPLTSSRPPLIA